MSRVSDIKDTALAVVNDSEFKMGTWSVQQEVAKRLGMDIHMDGHTDIDGLVARALQKLFSEGLIVKLIESTGRGRQKAASWYSLELAEVKRQEAEARYAKIAARDESRQNLTASLQHLGFKVSVIKLTDDVVQLEFAREDVPRLIASILQT